MSASRRPHGKVLEATQRLGVTHPIVQGPFGGGLSTPRLCATVSELGGLGSYGAHLLAPNAIAPLVREIRELTSRPFAVNLWVSDHDPGGLELSEPEFERIFQSLAPYFRELGVERPTPPERYGYPFEEQLDALLSHPPPVFSFVFGCPSPAQLAECKRRGIVTIGAATSIAEARLLDEARVDLIVASGSEAGGHRPSFLAPAEESLMGTLALTQLIAQRVRAPVIAAGGISDVASVRAVLELGAGAAQLGTAFLACEESAAAPLHREMLFSERAQRTTLTRAFTGRLARGIANRWTRELAGKLDAIAPYPIQSWFLAQLRPAALASGDAELIALWCGQAAPNLQHRTATDLMNSLLTYA